MSVVTSFSRAFNNYLRNYEFEIPLNRDSSIQLKTMLEVCKIVYWFK